MKVHPSVQMDQSRLKVLPSVQMDPSRQKVLLSHRYFRSQEDHLLLWVRSLLYSKPFLANLEIR